MALLAMASSISDSISMLLVLAVVMNQPPKCVYSKLSCSGGATHKGGGAILKNKFIVCILFTF